MEGYDPINYLTPRAYLVHNDLVVGHNSSSEYGIRLEVQLHSYMHFPSRVELRFYVRYNTATIQDGKQISVYLTRYNIRWAYLVPWSNDICPSLYSSTLGAGRELLALRIAYQVPNSEGPHANGLYTSEYFQQQDLEINRLRSLFRSPVAEFHLLIEDPHSLLWENALLYLLETRFWRERIVHPLCRFKCHVSTIGFRHEQIIIAPQIEEQMVYPIDTTIRTVFMNIEEYAAIMANAYHNEAYLRWEYIREFEELHWEFRALRGYDSIDGAIYGFMLRKTTRLPGVEGRHTAGKEAETLWDEEDHQRTWAAITNSVYFTGCFNEWYTGPSLDWRCTVVGGLPMQPQYSIPIRLVPRYSDRPRYTPRDLLQVPQGSLTTLSEPLPFRISLRHDDSVLHAQIGSLEVLQKIYWGAHIRLLLGNEPNCLEQPRMSVMERLCCPPSDIDDCEEFMSFDEEQKEGVRQTMTQKPPGGVVLIAGPSGTGKGKIVEQSVRHIIRQNAGSDPERRVKVLVLSRFHAVVKHLADIFVPYGMEDLCKVVQCEDNEELFNSVVSEVLRRKEGGPISEFKNVVAAGSVAYWLLKRTGKLDETAGGPDEMDDIRYGNLEDEEENGSSSGSLGEDLSRFERRFGEFWEISNSYWRVDDFKKEVYFAGQAIMEDADIVLATIDVFGHASWRWSFQADVIYILNGDSVSEPEMWPILASQKKFRSLTLLGDLRPPFPPSPTPMPSDGSRPTHPFEGLPETSFFHRLHNAGTRCVLLKTQYTMHTDIGRLVNFMCYEDQTIQHHVPEPIRLLGSQVSAFNKSNFGHSSTVTFLSTSVSTMRTPIARTVCNHENVDKTRQLLEMIETQQLVAKTDIMILTPYFGQSWEYAAKKDTPAFSGVQIRNPAETHYPSTSIVILDFPTTGDVPRFARSKWSLRSCLAAATAGLYIIGDETLLQYDDQTQVGRIVQFCKENNAIFPKAHASVEAHGRGPT